MRLIFVLLSVFLACAAPPTDGFVLIRGGEFQPGRPATRLDDFEMAVHPVTNAEYKAFVDATGHPAPLGWSAGQIPPGMEKHPVVFVNRYDAAAYLKWRSARESRAYRLPTIAEFEYAQRGGNPKARYPWGDAPPAGRANYDADSTRPFTAWREFLRPVASYPPNPYGLYDMAGNVWQMVDSVYDPATVTFTYRIENPIDRESSIAGGSWARSASYLECGRRGGAGTGIRHPDLGFRVVRQPSGAAHFRLAPRRLIAAPTAGGAVFLSWQILPSDTPETAFHVYRASRRDVSGERLTSAPLTGATNFIDSSPPSSGRFWYRVRPVAPNRPEGPPSEWAAAEGGAAPSNVIAVFEPTPKQTGAVPIFGDLNGDGLLDAVLRLDNGIRETSRDPGVPVELEAFSSHGRSLWRRPLVFHDHCFGSASNVPVVVHDLDADGKAEVIARLQQGDDVFLAVLDGMNGRVLRKTPWTPMATDFTKSSTRIHLAVAYLDGRNPALITQTGLYENEIFDAYDAHLRKLWTFKSFAETNGSGSHHIDVADLDGDGRDEVFDGTTVLNPDGSLRWSLYRLHPDIVAIKHILPNSPSRQVYYAIESSTHAGAYLVDAPTGRILWKVNREDDPRWAHAHVGWAADIWDGSPGMEMLTNRDGHLAEDQLLFSAHGKILMNPFPRGWRPVNWTGAPARDLLSGDGRRLARFTGAAVEPLPGIQPVTIPDRASCQMTADLAGDFRDELICTSAGKVMVFTNTTPAPRREITRTANREYRLWLARNLGGGYGSYFEWEP